MKTLILYATKYGAARERKSCLLIDEMRKIVEKIYCTCYNNEHTNVINGERHEDTI